MGFLQAIILAAIASILVGETACHYDINFTSFNLNSDAGNFNMLNSTMSSGALQVTQDTSNSASQYSLENISGRSLLKESFRLYRGNKTATFSSYFVFNIQPKNGSGGEGLAFIITSDDYLPDNSYGKWLGLFNASTNGSSSSKVLAVEFDTRKSPGTNDPDGNHVGINVNGINSINFTSLDQVNLTGDYNGKTNYYVQALIEYDGQTKKLDVYVAKNSTPMPTKPVVSSIIDLSTILDQKAYFGFSASTGVDTELNCVISWNFSIDPVSLPNRTLVIALPICLSLAVVFVIGIIVFSKRRKSQKQEEKKIFEALEKIPGRLFEFSYKDLKKATSNFSPATLLGAGGFGSVYKGILPKGKNVVAVKRMAKDAKRGKEEFIAEISVINRLRHRNLVPLLGWCHEKGELIMVYEYMPNGSLDKHIFNDDLPGEFLDWDQRYNIVSGVASALMYLHEECEQVVIHRDVKASNIMVDSEYNARLGDFGLARLIEHDRRSFTATGLVGTMGYIAPECFHTGRPTVESDVFSFGVVALEVTCGRPPTFRTPESFDLIGWVWKLYGENRLLEAADTGLTKFGSISVNVEDIRRLLLLGLACSNPNPEDRPNMREVTQILARTMPPPDVPRIRPAFVWSHMAFEVSFATGSSSGSVPTSLNALLPPSDLIENGIGR